MQLYVCLEGLTIYGEWWDSLMRGGGPCLAGPRGPGHLEVPRREVWGELSEKKLCLGRVGRAWENTWGERQGAGWVGLDLLLERGQLGEALGRTPAGRLSQVREGPTCPLHRWKGPAEAQVGLQGLPWSPGTSSGLNLPRGLGGRSYYPFYRWDS